MPFDVDLTRRAAPLSRDGLSQLAGAFERVKRSDTLYWVFHPEAADPFFAMELAPDGRIVLSASYSSHRFLRNFIELLDVARQLAQRVQADAVERVGGRAVTAESLDALIAPRGEYASLQLKVFSDTRERMNAEGLAGLEFPLGGLDVVSEFVAFEVREAAALPGERAREVLEEDVIWPVAVREVQPGAWLLLDAADDAPLARATARPDGSWRLAPVWGYAPFRAVASATMDAAEALAQATEGTLHFDGHPVTDALRAELLRRSDKSLGVAVFEWTRTLGGAT